MSFEALLVKYWQNQLTPIRNSAKIPIPKLSYLFEPPKTPGVIIFSRINPISMKPLNPHQGLSTSHLKIPAILRLIRPSTNTHNVQFDTEASMILAKLAELFLRELSFISLLYAVSKSRNIIRSEDIGRALASRDVFDFLFEMLSIRVSSLISTSSIPKFLTDPSNILNLSQQQHIDALMQTFQSVSNPENIKSELHKSRNFVSSESEIPTGNPSSSNTAGPIKYHSEPPSPWGLSPENPAFAEYLLLYSKVNPHPQLRIVNPKDNLVTDRKLHTELYKDAYQVLKLSSNNYNECLRGAYIAGSTAPQIERLMKRNKIPVGAPFPKLEKKSVLRNVYNVQHPLDPSTLDDTILDELESPTILLDSNFNNPSSSFDISNTHEIGIEVPLSPSPSASRSKDVFPFSYEAAKKTFQSARSKQPRSRSVDDLAPSSKRAKLNSRIPWLKLDVNLRLPEVFDDDLEEEDEKEEI